MEVSAMSNEHTVSREVEVVLSGALAYDDISVDAQARVRQVWDQRMADRRNGIDLATEFRERGRGWSECDADGSLVRCR